MKNKNKGFTLIELLVVISIISLLSSIVLASIKRVRENAQITKTVSEMKSLQTALELYKNKFGVYPGVIGTIYTTNEFMDGGGNFIDKIIDYGLGTQSLQYLLETYLSTFLPKIPTPPNNSDYYIGYLRPLNNVNTYYVCNRQKINNYFIYFYTSTRKINLPILEQVFNGTNPITMTTINPVEESAFNESQRRIYCISM